VRPHVARTFLVFAALLLAAPVVFGFLSTGGR